MAAGVGRRVTPAATLVLPSTVGPDTPEREQWLALRRGTNIGSSDVAPILGVEEAGPAVQVWLEKRGVRPDYDNEYMYWGRQLEDTVAREWAKRNQSAVERVGVVSNVETPWMLTTLDRRVIECPLHRDQKRACALEIKCRGAFRPTRFHHEIPDDILAQTTWQYLTTGYDHVHVAALVGGNRYTQTLVRRDDTFAAWLLQQVAAWRERHLVQGIAPAWEYETKAKALLELDTLLHPDRAGDIELTVEDIGEVMEYARLAARKGAADRAVKAQRAKLAHILDGRQRGLFAGRQAMALEPRRKVKVDVETLAERWPEVYAEVVTKTEYHQLSLSPEIRAGSTDEE